jgi:aminoglycoside 3-N-acetyltransferase
MSTVTLADICQALQTLGLSGKPICVHSSLRSFGWVERGADTIVDAVLAEGCTLLVPTFSHEYATPPAPGQRPERNAYDYTAGYEQNNPGVFRTSSNDVEKGMGAIPAVVLARPGRVRGYHPLNSFAAVGPLAHTLIDGQQPFDVYAPLRALADAGGSVILMGRTLTNLTLLHLAEQMSGRTLFRRWANGLDGIPIAMEVGSCSEGFDRLAPALAAHLREITVGQSVWKVYPARETLLAATQAMRADQNITHCDNPDCERCRDSIAGGPIV